MLTKFNIKLRLYFHFVSAATIRHLLEALLKNLKEGKEGIRDVGTKKTISR
jgi:hypothetical protein